jgi:hypothetical protein
VNPGAPDIQKLQPIIKLVAQALQEKETCKITICIHQGGIRDLSIDKKVNLEQQKS